MKSLFSTLMLLASITTLISCKKENAEDTYLTSEEAAEVMSHSVSDQNDGVVAHVEGHAWLSVSGSDSTQCIFNETLVRTGFFVSQLQRKITFMKDVTLKMVNVTVDRATKKIVTGSVEILVKGTTETGRSFTYAGTLTFKGNNQGTLLLQNGQATNLQW
jgi:hypothetical protein